MERIDDIKTRINFIFKHSDEPQDYADVIQVSNSILDVLSQESPSDELDNLKTLFWNFIFKAEDFLGITYSNENGYTNYPTWVFHK